MSEDKREVAFATFATKEIEEYSKYTNKVNSLYCKKHNYSFFLETNYPTGRYASWGKVLLMGGLIDDFDIVFLLDADAMIIDHSRSIESFLVDDKDFYILDDSPLRGRPFSAGTGTMICVVDTPEKKDYFKKIIKRWWNIGEQLELENRYFYEQTAMNIMLFELDYMGLNKRTTLFDHKEIYKFIFHAYALTMEDRVATLKNKMENLGITF